MPLSLTIPRHGGVHIGDRKLEIVSTNLLVRVRLDDGSEFALSDHTMAEILPDIRVGLTPSSTRTKVCLAIEAPRTVPIRRVVPKPSLDDL